MKLILTVLVAAVIGQANTYTYSFDTKLEFDIIDYKSGKKNEVVFYTNSGNNSYFASTTPVNRKKCRLNFFDSQGPVWKGKIEKTKIASEKIVLDGVGQGSYHNPYTYQADNYDFFPMPDTVVGTRTCKRFLLRSTKPDREKEKKLWRVIYVIDTTTQTAPLLTFSTAREIYRQRKGLPDGLIREIIHMNHKKEIKVIERLRAETVEKREISIAYYSKNW